MFQSIFLDYCWVCAARTGLHNHHIIPQAYGGVDGPQVTICGTCHTTIHAAGLRAPSEWRAMTPNSHRDKLFKLIKIIYDARIATKGNPNKPLKMQIEFTTERSKKLRELKQLLGVSSLSTAVDVCIDKMYAQLKPLAEKKRE